MSDVYLTSFRIPTFGAYSNPRKFLFIHVADTSRGGVLERTLQDFWGVPVLGAGNVPAGANFQCLRPSGRVLEIRMKVP